MPRSLTLTGSSPSVNVTFSGNIAAANGNFGYGTPVATLALGSATVPFIINGGAYEGDAALDCILTGTGGLTVSSTGATGLDTLWAGYPTTAWCPPSTAAGSAGH